MKSQACSGSSESPVAGTVPSQCPSLLSEVSEAWPLRACLSGALPRPPCQFCVGGAASGRRCSCAFLLLLLPDAVRHG